MVAINTKIEEIKKEIVSVVNKSLRELPTGVVQLILSSTMAELNQLHKKSLAKEAEELLRQAEENHDGKESED